MKFKYYSLVTHIIRVDIILYTLHWTLSSRRELNVLKMKTFNVSSRLFQVMISHKGTYNILCVSSLLINKKISFLFVWNSILSKISCNSKKVAGNFDRISSIV